MTLQTLIQILALALFTATAGSVLIGGVVLFLGHVARREADRDEWAEAEEGR